MKYKVHTPYFSFNEKQQQVFNEIVTDALAFAFSFKAFDVLPQHLHTTSTESPSASHISFLFFFQSHSFYLSSYISIPLIYIFTAAQDRPGNTLVILVLQGFYWFLAKVSKPLWNQQYHFRLLVGKDMPNSIPRIPFLAISPTLVISQLKPSSLTSSDLLTWLDRTKCWCVCATAAWNILCEMSSDIGSHLKEKLSFHPLTFENS